MSKPFSTALAFAALSCLVLPFLSCAGGGPATPAAVSSAPTTAFVGVPVIPKTAGGGLLRDQTVLVRGDRIAPIGPRGGIEVPVGAEVILLEANPLEDIGSARRTAGVMTRPVAAEGPPVSAADARLRDVARHGLWR